MSIYYATLYGSSTPRLTTLWNIASSECPILFIAIILNDVSQSMPSAGGEVRDTARTFPSSHSTRTIADIVPL